VEIPLASDILIIQTPDGDFGAYVARPAVEPAPAIVVLQEIFGVNAVMRGVCDDLAAKGYLAVCPDLFWRIEPGIDITDQTEAEWKQALALFNAFDVEAGVGDIAGTLDAVRADPRCTGKVGAIGFCLGGLLAFLTATRTNSDATVAYYGVNIDKYVAEAEKLAAPLMLHVAEEDEFVPKPAQAQIHAGLANHARIEVFTYPGQGHAFARRGGAHYHAASADLARGRTLGLFDKALR
jgi:carboxymethylenebutenolidase